MIYASYQFLNGRLLDRDLASLSSLDHLLLICYRCLVDGPCSRPDDDPVVAETYCLNVELRVKDCLLRVDMLSEGECLKLVKGLDVRSLFDSIKQQFIIISSLQKSPEYYIALHAS